jgi:hypothetical protein
LHQLIKNISALFLGLILVISPEFFTRISKKWLNAEAKNQTTIKLFLRIIGVAFLIVTFISSRYLLQEFVNSL